VAASAVGRPVEVQAYADRIVIRQDGRIVAEHQASLKFLTQVALAGPGTSLLRVCLQFNLLKFDEGPTVHAAGDSEPEKIFSTILRTAHGPIRRFFNHSHAGLVIRKLDLKGKPTHLERTAAFCARNHLSAVMDELAFLMEEDLPPVRGAAG
jgi:hypothetical protein